MTWHRREQDAFSFHRWCKFGVYGGNTQSFFCQALHHLAVQLCYGYRLTCFISIFEMSAKFLCPIVIAIFWELSRCGGRGSSSSSSEDFAISIYHCAESVASIEKIQNCGIGRVVQIGSRLGCKVRLCYFLDRTIIFGYLVWS